VPVADNDSLGPWWGFAKDSTPERAIAVADALDGVVVQDRGYVKIGRAFGPITYQVTLYARDICEEREELTKVSVLPEALARRERT
jgi:hypothetical protein